MNQIEYTGYIPGAIGRVTELHARYYHLNWGFDHRFEAEVARELSEFILFFEPERDYFMTARTGGGIVGSIAIAGKRGESEGARLRWFIVADGHAGTGIGKKLMEGAVDFCRSAGHRRIFLWTFKGLDRARHIYEKNGFRLAEEYGDAVWGNTIVHQKFILDV